MKKMKSTIFFIVLFLLQSNFFINAQNIESQQSSLAKTSAERPLEPMQNQIKTVSQPVAPPQSGANPVLMALPLPVQTKSSDVTHPSVAQQAATQQNVTPAQPSPTAATQVQQPATTVQPQAPIQLPISTQPQPSAAPTTTPQSTEQAEQKEQEAQPVAAAPAVAVQAAPQQTTAPESLVKEQEIPQAPVIKDGGQTEAEPEVEVPAVQKQKAQKSYEEQEGIDTLEQEGGNWLLKRQALEKTMDVIEKIKDVFTKILESRVDYLVKRNKTDRSFDIFANKIGFQLGDLNQLLSTLVSELKEERKEDGDLTEEEREVLSDVENKIADLKKLKKTLDSITDMDASLDDALMRLEEEINTSNNYQNKAWKNFQTIKKVLSDEKAEELYLQTQSLLKNIQDIYVYLKGDLLNYFNNVISNLKQAMNTVEGSMKALSDKGIDLQQEVKKIRDEDKDVRTVRIEAEEKKKIEDEAVQKKESKKESQKGWFDSISFLWNYPLNFFKALSNYLSSFFVSETIEPRPRNVTSSESSQK